MRETEENQTTIDDDRETAPRAGAGVIKRRDVLKIAASALVAAPLLDLDETNAQTKKPRAPKSAGAAKTAAGRPRFFTAAEFAMLDELTELIIPTDDHSPGARAAGVALYLDRRVAETDPKIPEYAKLRVTWRDGLKLVDAVAREANGGKAFMEGTADERIAVLTRMAAGEERSQPERQADPPRPEEQPQKQQTPGQPGEIYKEGAQNRPEQKNPGATRKSEGDFFTFLKSQTARAYYTSEIGLMQELEYKGNQYLDEFVGYDVNGKYTAPPNKAAKA